MDGLMLIFFCLGLGKLISKHTNSPGDFIKHINLIVIRIAMPALILDKLHALTFSGDAWLPILTPWVIMVVTIISIYFLKLFIPISRVTTGCLILMAGTGNTSFVGVPLLNALIGEQAIGLGLLVDQSNFVLLFTVGMLIANFYTGTSMNIRFLVTGIIKYPPVIALMLAIVLKPIPFPGFFQYTLTTLGSLLTPLTMLAVGAALRIPKDRGVFRYFTIGLCIKLIIAPFAIFMLAGLVNPSELTRAVVVLQAAMAPMVTSTIIAVDKGLNPELANFMTGAGIPISLLTVSAWALLL